jgi:hypothetical protein
MVSVVNSGDANIFSISTAGNVVATGGLTCGGTLTGTTYTVDSINVGNGNLEAPLFTAHDGELVNDAVGRVMLEVRGHTSQSANLIEIKNSAGVNKLTVSNAGALTVSGNMQIEDLSSGSTLDASGTGEADVFTAKTMQIFSDSSSRIPFTVRGHSSQSGNMMKVKDGAGTVKMTVNINGAANIGGSWTATNFLNGGFTWSQVTGEPTTISGYGINDAGTNTQAGLANTCLSNNNQIAYANKVNGKPTTLAGWGISTNNDGNYATKASGDSADSKCTSGCFTGHSINKGQIKSVFDQSDWGNARSVALSNNNIPNSHSAVTTGCPA